MCSSGLIEMMFLLDILNFINEKNPDILCIQEYSPSAKIDLKVFSTDIFLQVETKLKPVGGYFLNFQLLTKEILFFQIPTITLYSPTLKKGKTSSECIICICNPSKFRQM